MITGLAFRYRGSDAFVPDAPDAQEMSATRRGRDPLTFREQTETLAKLYASSASSAFELAKFTSVITLTTSHGRALVFGSNGTIIPWGPPDEFECGRGTTRRLRGAPKGPPPFVDWQSPDMEAFDVFHGATLCRFQWRYFSTAWRRHECPRPSQSAGQEEQGQGLERLGRASSADFEEGRLAPRAGALCL